LIRFLFIVLMSFSSLAIASQSDLVIARQGDFFKDFTLDMYEDSSAALSFKQIKEIKEFIPHSNRISTGYSKSFFWFKFKIKNATNSDENYFINFTEIMEELDFYIVSSNGEFIKYERGIRYFTDDRVNELKQPKFQINLSSGESKTVYFRIFGLYPIITALYVFDKESLNSYELKYDTLYAFYFGSIFALLLSNLFFYFFSREKSYFYYVLYVSFFLFWQLQFNAFPPFNSHNSSSSFYLNGTFIPICIAFLMFFSASLLETKILFPKVNRVIQYTAYFYVFLALSSVFFLHESFVIINGLTSIVLPFLLYVGFQSYLAGNKVALFFIFAQVSFISMTTLFSLMMEGYLEYTLLNRHGIAIGSFIEIILFSLALAYRIRVLQYEKLAIIHQSNIELDDKVKERTEELEQSRQKLKELANRDPMTNLYNRRCLYEISNELINIAKREKNPLSLIMFDIDKFKSINDIYGHIVGDEVIKIFAKLLLQTRGCDIAARIGGEEFVLLLPNTDQKGAYEIATQIREDVEKLKCQVLSYPPISFTVSGGVSTLLLENDNEIDQVLHRADKALYNAKKSGRNKIILSS